MVQVPNQNKIQVNAPLAHVLHTGSTEAVYTEIFEAVDKLFFDVTGRKIKIEIFISDGEMSLKNAADNVFFPIKNLLCCFHQSSNIRAKFCEFFKLELDDEECNFIKKLFNTIKWTIIIEKSLAHEILSILKMKIKKMRKKSKKLSLKLTRAKLLDIISYVEKKINRESEYTTPWLSEISQSDFLLDRSNNSIESSNGLLQSKLKKCAGSSVIKKLLFHKRASFNMFRTFNAEFYQKTKQRISHKKTTIYNNEMIGKISEAIQQKYNAQQMLTLLSHGYFS